MSRRSTRRSTRNSLFLGNDPAPFPVPANDEKLKPVVTSAERATKHRKTKSVQQTEEGSSNESPQQPGKETCDGNTSSSDKENCETGPIPDVATSEEDMHDSHDETENGDKDWAPEEEEITALNAQDQQTVEDIQNMVDEEEEIKAQRYAQLQLLLHKSSCYTKYLLKRIEEQKESIKDIETVQKVGTPPKKKRKLAKSKSTTTPDDPVLTDEAAFALNNGAPVLFEGTLRSYQVDGLLWLNSMYENGINGILADEMGLGKTIQCIATISHIIAMGVPGPFLIVVPLSTLPNWVNEFKRFAPKIPVMLYHGSIAEREVLRRDIRTRYEVNGQWNTQPVVCTSYEVAMKDSKHISNMGWKYLVVDEGHRIKNAQCRLIKELRMYDSTHRLLLTGTPLQNNLSELWSLLNFLLPEVFDDLDSFEYWFKLDCLTKDQQAKLIAEEKKSNILAMLHQIITPFLLRRLKADVELDLPPKREIVVYAPLSEKQKEFYSAIVDRTIVNVLEGPKSTEEKIDTSLGRGTRRSSTKKVDYSTMMAGIDKDDEDSLDAWVKDVMDQTAQRNAGKKEVATVITQQNNIKLQNIMMLLRKCCSHSYLLSQPVDPETGYCKISEDLLKCSGKLQLLDQMLKELKKTGHKVLVFSQMTKMLDLVEDYCQLRRFEYCRLDGSTSLVDRQEQMNSFNTDPDTFLFLLSTRAGGLGINLVSADTVIFMDSDWNPQCDLQAQDRAHRIGQVRPVMIYRMVCANTIDEKMVERATRKRRLEKMVIHKEKFKTGMTEATETAAKPVTPEELVELLKSEDHDAVVRQVITKKQLEALLDRSDLIEQWKGQDSDRKRKKRSVNTKSSSMSNVFKIVDDGRDSPISEASNETAER